MSLPELFGALRKHREANKARADREKRISAREKYCMVLQRTQGEGEGEGEGEGLVAVREPTTAPLCSAPSPSSRQRL
jgi:hypothetical protein